MATILTVATHEVVRSVYPRELASRDAIGIAAGKAIDTAVTELGHQYRARRRPTIAAADRLAQTAFDEELAAATVAVDSETRELQIRQIRNALRAFRSSPLLGLARPKSRLIVINQRVGIYAQPDYWDGVDRFYEMKTYHADPTPPDVTLQLRVFQLAFPGFHALLAEIDRHAEAVRAVIRPVPPLDDAEGERILRLAHDFALAHGQERVLEYIDSPVVRYSLHA